MTEFTIFPAIDLRNGKVVRLKTGDPARQTTYSDNPDEVAARWVDAGAKWLHIVNLDGALGEDDSANRLALKTILRATLRANTNIQFGGGLRTPEAIEEILIFGATRVVLGTAAIEQPELLQKMLATWGPERIAVGLDARNGQISLRGWKEDTALNALDVAKNLKSIGIRWIIFTDINRDGTGDGVNLEKTLEIHQKTGLQVIASGGIRSLEEVERVRQSGLPGVIIGRAIYEGQIDINNLFTERTNLL